MRQKLSGRIVLTYCFAVCFLLSFACTGVASAARIDPEWVLDPTSEWVTESPVPDDYAYSFMVLGDPQYINGDYPEYLQDMYDYIVENVREKNVKHVFTLGDLTDLNTPAEWERVREQYTRLNGLVPYSLVRGNHDTNEYLSVPDGTVYFDKMFGFGTPYAEQIADWYGNDTRNTVHTFSAGELDYLVLALDFGPSDAVLEWANDVVESHPCHNVIVTTHSYLDPDGTTTDTGESGAATSYSPAFENDGGDIWDKLISKHENIVLVLSGHVTSKNIVKTQRTGDNGNIVTEIMINPQWCDQSYAGLGLVSTFYMSEDGKTATVDYYSTSRKEYFGAANQFTVTLDTVPRDGAAQDGASSVTDGGADALGSGTSYDAGGAPDGRNVLWIVLGAAAAACVAVAALILLLKLRAKSR